ncbi:ZRANB2 [Bugula neritina]|uniref:ZRANB2 n=1 Tax=Bugula neritina TaxID=10212 RepID=A0A7J7J7R7_BUGNE|nr:ZRANB2 [Bugula neritina]
MSSRGGYSKNDGDWCCPDPKCGNTNFARRDKCNRCGCEKPQMAGKVKLGGFELGKQLAKKVKDYLVLMIGNVKHVGM